MIKYSDELAANNTVKELMLAIGRPYGDMYEVALWQDMLKVVGDEVFYAYPVSYTHLDVYKRQQLTQALAKVGYSIAGASVDENLKKSGGSCCC